MAVLEILEFPDPRLRKIAKKVTAVDDAVRKLCEDMLETMYDAPGIGLAATQIDVHKRIVVIDVSEDKNQPLVLINPEIEILGSEHAQYEEGCLSVPGFQDNVDRPTQVCIKALDKNGDAFELRPDGLLAVCVQHELDHLDGKLFVDHLSTLKRNRIKSKLQKSQRKR